MITNHDRSQWLQTNKSKGNEPFVASSPPLPLAPHPPLYVVTIIIFTANNNFKFPNGPTDIEHHPHATTKHGGRLLLHPRWTTTARIVADCQLCPRWIHHTATIPIRIVLDSTPITLTTRIESIVSTHPPHSHGATTSRGRNELQTILRHL